MSVAAAQQHNWHGEIRLRFIRATSKTILQSVRHAGPLRVQRPFYPEADVCHVILLHPPGGVVGGDRLAIEIDTDPAAHALLTTPGATKFYRSAGQEARLIQCIRLKEESKLEWFPQESILFPGARVKLQTDIYLNGDARFMGWDISCLGRPVNQETFDAGSLDGVLRVFRDNIMQFNERQRVFSRRQLIASAGLRGYPMNAVFLCTHCNSAQVEQVNRLLARQQPDFPTAVTLCDDLLILRALGKRTEALQKIMIAAWRILRPQIMGKAAMLPRIWST